MDVVFKRNGYLLGRERKGMILEGNFILIQSEMNEWIDFAINILDYRKYLDAKQIVD